MDPCDIYLYRITHYQNLEQILNSGLLCHSHPNTLTNYVGIGDRSLIKVRDELSIPILPGGTLRDYVSFYFGAHSPMLLQIATGNEGVNRLPQRDIIYILCNLAKILSEKLPFVFTDGHARNKLTEFYHHPEDLDKVDWSVVRERHWFNSEEDVDRKRRKQAEFLIYKEVPTRCFHALLVYDIERANFVKEALRLAGLDVPVYWDQNKKWYY